MKKDLQREREEKKGDYVSVSQFHSHWKEGGRERERERENERKTHELKQIKIEIE